LRVKPYYAECLLVLILLFKSSYAQEPDPTISALESARESYRNGEFKRAISQLQHALELMQDRMVDNIKQFFPKPFGPWEEMETETDSPKLSMSREVKVKRLYCHNKTSESIEVEIALDAIRATNLRAWIANPIELRRSSQGAELITINGHRCVEKFDQKMKNGEVSLVLGSGIFVRAVGDGIKKMDDVRKFIELMDFESIEAKVR
jgi:hypothetical protein